MRRLRERIGRRIEDPKEKRVYVRDLFAGIAGRYDLTNDVMSLGLHRRWKRIALEIADPPAEGRILDLAAGTGDLALGAVPLVDTTGTGRVVATDLTGEMIRVGRERDEAGEVHWVQSDALRLPFPSASFDRVVAGYALRNFADLDGSLAEVRRCLKPGGLLVSLDFAKPKRRLLRRAYLRYLELSTAVVGWLLHRNPEAYVYIPESLRRFPEQDALVGMLRAAGFDRCGYVELMFGTMAIHFAYRPDG